MNFDHELGPSAPPFRRMRAARQLQAEPDRVTMGELLMALERESVQPIRDQLAKVMQAKTEDKSTPNNFVERSNTASEAEKGNPGAELLMHLAELIQHELAPSLGFLELAATDEIEQFAASRTSRELASLRQRIGGLSRLTSAHRPLILEMLSLPDFLHAIVDSHGVADIVTVENRGSADQPLIKADKGLLELLISNALRNAQEALSRLSAGRRSVEITYSADSSGYWISIVNPFSGNAFSIDEVDLAGLSTKGLQRGYGVRVMKLLSSRMSLSLTLRGANGVAQLVIQKREDFATD